MGREDFCWGAVFTQLVELGCYGIAPLVRLRGRVRSDRTTITFYFLRDGEFTFCGNCYRATFLLGKIDGVHIKRGDHVFW